MIIYLLSAIASVIYVNFLEWSIHKYLLHDLGKDKTSIFAFHWHRHHRLSRKNFYTDPDYFVFPRWDTRGKEPLGLLILALIHLPLYYVAPLFLWGVFQGAAVYYAVHAYSHRHPEWARKWVPWHYAHHMGKNQNANYCVTWPFFDWVMGTRVVDPCEKLVGNKS